MIETLAGMSPSKTEDLLEEPLLAEVAVAGVNSVDPAATELGDPAEPSDEGVGDRPGAAKLFPRPAFA